MNIINDTYITKDWSTVVCDVKNRNQIGKYVALLRGKTFAWRKFREVKNSENFRDKLSGMTSNNAFRE